MRRQIVNGLNCDALETYNACEGCLLCLNGTPSFTSHGHLEANEKIQSVPENKSNYLVTEDTKVLCRAILFHSRNFQNPKATLRSKDMNR